MEKTGVPLLEIEQMYKQKLIQEAAERQPIESAFFLVIGRNRMYRKIKHW